MESEGVQEFIYSGQESRPEGKVLEKGSREGLDEGIQKVPLLSLQLLPASFFHTLAYSLSLSTWQKMAVCKDSGLSLLKGPAQIETGHS